LQKDTIKKGCANAACYATDTWINDTDCSASNKTCQNNSCVAGASNSNPVSLPTVNITANGNQNSIAADAGVPVTISWASTNADICRASGDWSGNLATSSTQTIASNNSKTYTVTCSNSSGSSSASVAVNIQPVQSINTTTGTKTNTNTNTNTTVQQPVVQMTRAQLLAAITQIQSAIAGLQKQLAALTGTTTTTFSCAQITKNLFYGMASDPQTKCLQEVLKSQGYAVIASGNYDAATKTAVALFQQKYAGEILAPFGLKYGSGNVGNSTRAKLNQIISVK
jgi:hypothetical protein